MGGGGTGEHYQLSSHCEHRTEERRSSKPSKVVVSPGSNVNKRFDGGISWKKKYCCNKRARREPGKGRESTNAKGPKERDLFGLGKEIGGGGKGLKRRVKYAPKRNTAGCGVVGNGGPLGFHLDIGGGNT